MSARSSSAANEATETFKKLLNISSETLDREVGSSSASDETPKVSNGPLDAFNASLDREGVPPLTSKMTLEGVDGALKLSFQKSA